MLMRKSKGKPSVAGRERTQSARETLFDRDENGGKGVEKHYACERRGWTAATPSSQAPIAVKRKNAEGRREIKRVLPGSCAMRAATAPDFASDSLNLWVTTRLPVTTP